MPYRIEPHRLRDRLVGKLLFIPASLRLLAAVRGRRPTEFWIGDSHAMAVNRPVTNSNFMTGPGGMLVLRAGPKLMYSLATKGFPARVTRVVALIRPFTRTGALVPVFSAGDIDVRAHLVNHPETDFGFVEDYVALCVRTAERLRARRLAFLVPPPPVDAREEDVWFPVVGTMEDRLLAQKALVAALTCAVAAVPNADLIDLTDLLTGPTGGMPIEYTLDGAHTNAATVATIRERIAEHRLTA